MGAIFSVVGRNMWMSMGVTLLASLAAAATEYYQLMAILLCALGGLLMWEAERRPGLSAGAEADLAGGAVLTEARG